VGGLALIWAEAFGIFHPLTSERGPNGLVNEFDPGRAGPEVQSERLGIGSMPAILV